MDTQKTALRTGKRVLYSTLYVTLGESIEFRLSLDFSSMNLTDKPHIDVNRGGIHTSCNKSTKSVCRSECVRDYAVKPLPERWNVCQVWSQLRMPMCTRVGW